jgi:hypothetical protein
MRSKLIRLLSLQEPMKHPPMLSKCIAVIHKRGELPTSDLSIRHWKVGTTGVDLTSACEELGCDPMRSNDEYRLRKCFDLENGAVYLRL